MVLGCALSNLRSVPAPTRQERPSRLVRWSMTERHSSQPAELLAASIKKAAPKAATRRDRSGRSGIAAPPGPGAAGPGRSSRPPLSHPIVMASERSISASSVKVRSAYLSALNSLSTDRFKSGFVRCPLTGSSYAFGWSYGCDRRRRSLPGWQWLGQHHRLVVPRCDPLKRETHLSLAGAGAQRFPGLVGIVVSLQHQGADLEPLRRLIAGRGAWLWVWLFGDRPRPPVAWPS